MIVMAAYYALTWLYSLAIKRIVVADVMALAGLYAARIVPVARRPRILDSVVS